MVKLVRTAIIFGLGYAMGAGGCHYMFDQLKDKPVVTEYKQELSDKIKQEADQIINETIEKHLGQYRK